MGKVRMPGVEPGSQAWEACMMPLHYMRHCGAESRGQLAGLAFSPRRTDCTTNTRGGTRTRNLLLRREAPYPLGHTSADMALGTDEYLVGSVQHSGQALRKLSSQHCR